MTAATFSWFIYALCLLGAEFLTGTFYLLVIAVGLLGGGFAAVCELSPAWQWSIASVVSMVGLSIVAIWRCHHSKTTQAVKHNNDLDMDQDVTILHMTSPKHMRVAYRGAQWDAILQETETNEPSIGDIVRIIKRNGNVLIVSTHDKRKNE